jgi:hypothetical protein
MLKFRGAREGQSPVSSQVLETVLQPVFSRQIPVDWEPPVVVQSMDSIEHVAARGMRGRARPGARKELALGGPDLMCREKGDGRARKLPYWSKE